MARRFLIVLGISVLTAAAAFAASYVVPADRDFVRQAPVIALGSAIASHVEADANGGVATATAFSIEEVIKGSIGGDTIDIFEPGGAHNGRAFQIAGTPRFTDGARYLLFLMKSGDGRWHVFDFGLGRFRFATDVSGHDVILRDLEDSLALEPSGGSHHEPVRAAQPFLDFVRAAAGGGPARENYVIEREPLIDSYTRALGRLRPIANTVFTADSYTMDMGFGDLHGARWTSFPQTFKSIGSETGAPGTPVAGQTAITNAMNSWNATTGASINYAYGGNDSSGTTNVPGGGCVGATSDGKNTIAFEYDLTCYGIANFSCTPTSYSGVLGLGGPVASGSTNTTPDGSTLHNTIEGDVWMNKGIANCTLLLGQTPPGDFDSAVMHELGHTLGFRHSDQNRTFSGACGTDAIAEECNTTTAIMKSFITTGIRAVEQTWDQHAASLVYQSTAPAAPTGVSATATGPTTVHIFWSGSCSTACHVYRSADRVTFTLVGSPAASPFDDTTAPANTAFLYKVRAFNGTTESPDSPVDLAVTVIYTDDPLTASATSVKAVHVTELRTMVNAMRALTGLTAATFTDPSLSSSITIKAQHINELRTDLDQAMTVLGSVTGGYTNTLTASTTLIHAVDVQEIRNRTK